MNRTIERAAAVAAVIFAGAIFGFYYAWVCSTMWGLDAADPRIAIGAMQAMNASVRNWLFMPAFFLTPLVVAVYAAVLLRAGRRRAALLAGAAVLVFAFGSVAFTSTFNLPLNEHLGSLSIPDDLAAARAVWNDYSPQWQRLNQIRTILSGLGLTLVALAVADRTPRRNRAKDQQKSSPADATMRQGQVSETV